jgi:ABC-type sugar transport system permease subunit
VPSYTATPGRLAERVRPARPPGLLVEVWRSRWQYAAISPFYIVFAVLGLFPLLYTVVLSLYQWSGTGPWQPVGLANYLALAGHAPFRAALFNSVYYLAVGVPILVVGSLVTAAILNNHRLRFRGAYRTIFFLPYVTSEIIVAIVFFAVFDRGYGLINGFLGLLGIGPVPWLVSPAWSKIPVLVLFIWSRLGYYLILMLAGLQSISRELYEAAAIDGANGVQAFRYVTVPLMRGIILFVLVTTTIAVLNLFGAPFVLTGGGPQESSTSLTLLLYQTAFRWTNYGLASAVAVVITLITIAIALVQIKVVGIRDRD